MSSCKICGDENCKKHSFLLGKSIQLKEFSGSSPPEIFIGRYNYPNVYAGILSPTEYGNQKILSSPELWHENKLSIQEILKLRNQLIYGRSQTNIKKVLLDNKMLPVIQEVAMTEESVATEFKLKRAITAHDEPDKKVPLISNAAQVEKISLLENTKIKPKVDYLTSDGDLKSTQGMVELDKYGIDTSTIVKILSAGLLGIKRNRKLVPTRWSITAVDDSLSKNKLNKIRFYKEIMDFQVFSGEYLGNHYEFLLMPEKWSFEVLEISLGTQGIWQDYETFFPRKTYADDVSGAYYANRLAVTEYLDRIKKQAHVVVFREIRPEYNVPLGVGILRQTSREAFSHAPRKFFHLKEALDDIQSRLKQPITNYTEKSSLLMNYGKQQKLSQFF